MLLRRMFIMLGIVLVTVLLLAAYKGYSIYQQIQTFSAPAAAINVSAIEARQQDWQTRLSAIGSLKAFEGVEIASEVQGVIHSIGFQSGEKVKAGQRIIELDDLVERAALATAEAEFNLANVQFQRGQSLLTRQAISQSEFDQLKATRLKTEATVQQLRAQLDKRHIKAPFSGTLGIRLIDVGQYLSPGMGITTLQNLSQLYVDFYVPEQYFPQLQLKQTLEVRVSAYPNEPFIAQISAIEPKIDQNTRNLLVRATLDNHQEKLLPGMFANLEVLLELLKDQVVIPESAITFSLYGDSVYVVVPRHDEQGQALVESNGQPQLSVERRFIRTGERRDGWVRVVDGIKAGEQIVSSGQLKLDNGAYIKLVDDPVPLQPTSTAP